MTINNTFVLPLNNNPNQVFSSDLTLSTGIVLNLQFKISWNQQAKYWVLGIYDNNAQVNLLDNIPLITASQYPYKDILWQYQFLGIGHLTVFPIYNPLKDPLPPENPAIGDWGNNFLLIWLG